MDKSARLTAAVFVPVTGMVRVVACIVPPEMTNRVSTLAIQRRDKKYVGKIGTGPTVPRTAFQKIVIGLVITIVTRSTAEDSVIMTGMEATALSSVPHAMTPTGITRAMEQMEVRTVWMIGLELSAKRIVKQRTTLKGTTSVVCRMEPRCATKAGMELTV